jgi:hypothetical protein
MIYHQTDKRYKVLAWTAKDNYLTTQYLTNSKDWTIFYLIKCLVNKSDFGILKNLWFSDWQEFKFLSNLLPSICWVSNIDLKLNIVQQNCSIHSLVLLQIKHKYSFSELTYLKVRKTKFIFCSFYDNCFSCIK